MAAQLRHADACHAALSVRSRALRTDQSMKGNIMRTFYKRARLGTLIAGGITLLGATVANAAETTGDDGLLSGSQAIIDVNLPVNLSGTALSVLGDSRRTSVSKIIFWTSVPTCRPNVYGKRLAGS